MRYTTNGTAVTTFVLAVDRPFAKDGQQDTDFIQVVTWSGLAEAVANHCRKGRQVGVSGRIQTRNYENNEGQKVYVTEVVADEVEFLAKPKSDNGAA